MKKFLIGLAVTFFLSSHAYALEVPVLKGRVNDYANELTPQQVNDLEVRLKQEEAATSNQIVILTIPSLEGEDLEGYTIKVATAWAIGQKGKDNGVLIFQSTGDHKIRIEVGNGLEGSLTDARSSEIIRNTMVPNFKAGNFFTGYSGAISDITSSIKGEYKSSETTMGENEVGGFFAGFLILLFICGFLGTLVHDLFGGLIGAVGLPFLTAATLQSEGLTLVLHIVVGLVFGFIASVFFRSANGGGGGGGGVYGGGSPSGGNDGGFSGGGGGFSGGGSSGSY